MAWGTVVLEAVVLESVDVPERRPIQAEAEVEVEAEALLCWGVLNWEQLTQ